MTVTHRDRLWLAGGGIGAAILLAVAWFLLISPQNGQTSGLRDQQVSAEAQIVTLRHRLADLRTQQANLPRYQAQLSQDRAALPTAPALSDFLRELESAGDAVGVHVSAMTAGTPAEVTAGGTRLQAITVDVTAAGSTGQLTQFIAQVQQIRSRAALVEAVHLDTAQNPGEVTVGLTLKVFVAPAAASPRPSASGG
jgi:Tfp pilus assembly protein PilO